MWCKDQRVLVEHMLKENRAHLASHQEGSGDQHAGNGLPIKCKIFDGGMKPVWTLTCVADLNERKNMLSLKTV